MSLASLPRPLRLALYAGAAAVLLALTLAPSEDLPSVNLWDKAEHALAWMVPGELALFGLDELEQAKQWAAG